MTISERIKENADRVELALMKRLDAVAGDCADCETLAGAMRYAVLDGGKRVRPFLAVESCRAAGGCFEDAEPFACAIEFIHSYSLVHDDMPCMDNDLIRRGKPSVHAKFGEATALLCGDALLTLAFECAASSPDPRKAAQAVTELAKYAGAAGMCGGQMIDLTLKPDEATRQTVKNLQTKKTGALIRAAVICGVIASGNTDVSVRENALIYAAATGEAFQIRDDLLDAGTEDDRATALSYMNADEAEAEVERLTCIAETAAKKFDQSGVLADFARYIAGRTA